MKTKAQLQEEFGWVGPRFFLLNLPEGESPYTEATWYISGDVHVARADDGSFYAASTGSGHPDFTTEITE